MFNLPYLIESSIILALGYTIYRLIFASDKAYIRNRVYLLVLLLLSFLLPLISLPVYVQKVIVKPLRADNLLTFPSSQSVIEQSGFDWNTILSMIYLGVVALLFVRLMYHIVFIRHILSNSQSKIVDGVKHLITDQLTTPASIFNTLLTDNSDLPQAVIDHEKVHMRHGHTWDVLIMEISKIILWFNPFVYLTSRELKDNHEFIADHLASKSVTDEMEYSYLLLQYAKSIKAPILLNTFSTITKKRIIMLSKETTNHTLKSFLLFPILCGIVSLFSFDTYTVNVNMDGTIVTDSIPDTRLDTIIEFDSDTGDESMTIERVYVNDIKTIIDTVTTFDYDTKKETVQIVRSDSPRTEVILQTYITNEYNSKTGDMKTNTYHIFPQEMVESTDTVITFNYDTYEEIVEVVKGERPREKLISTKVTPKKSIKEGQRSEYLMEMKNISIIKSDTTQHKPKGNK